MKLNNKNIEIKTNGSGEISSIKYKGTEILHTTKEKWAKTFPVIWPVVGISKGFEIDGKVHEIKKHGFWNDLEWTEFIENGSIVLAAVHMANGTYPFTLDLQQFISISGDSVLIETEIANISKGKAFFQFGLHPAFATDDNSRIKIDSKSEGLEIDFDGVLTDTKIDANGLINEIPFGEKFDTIIYRNVSTNKIKLKGEKFKLEIEHDANNLQIWKPKGADFICIEPWYGIGDTLCNSPTEASKKLEIISLEKGQRWKSSMSIKIKK